jgi:hypothetical protein
MKAVRWLFLSLFWLLLKQAPVRAVDNIGLSIKSPYANLACLNWWNKMYIYKKNEWLELEEVKKNNNWVVLCRICFDSKSNQNLIFRKKDFPRFSDKHEKEREFSSNGKKSNWVVNQSFNISSQADKSIAYVLR